MNHPSRLTLATITAGLLLAACGKTEDRAQPNTASETAAEQACGKVTVASMGWESAEVLAQVDRFVLTHAYGCEVELVPGDTMPTLSAMMETGEPDVAPEGWINAARQPLATAMQEGRLHFGARALLDGGVEGWWIPKYVADAHPEIKTIDDALKHPELFPSAVGPKRGAVHNCPSGWHCRVPTEHAFKAWGAAEKGFELVDVKSASELDESIAKAYESEAGWLGYYWAPTSMLGRYEMVKLDAGVPHDTEAWETCNAMASCANPVRNDWAQSEVFTVMTDRFYRKDGPAVRYLEVRGWENHTVNALLAWMRGNKASAEEAAKHFLKTQPEVWNVWVTHEMADKIKAAL
ncbi:glycine betaine ABC transporter substrate-binding protein [Hydrogenophaga sp.]|uniref:glycine betaine ABC transporter substrate-binding protein n=1 Tax=Hydrogenophaga sp. TaxID=1904254 RepID=UPI002726C990|nr:glycine betaine ABC transporter substrate-binding protein [Hydrogenophaga sp.]MDO8906821.1 glycine betaine ABC transporter substrate-binding protein [Hydrogenophaga sp.]